MVGFTGGRPTIRWFDLVLMKDFFLKLSGRLIVRWPKQDRNWWWADRPNNVMKARIAKVSIFDGLKSGSPSQSNESDSFDDFLPDSSDGLERVLREVKKRLGQGKFKKRLLIVYKRRCAVTECDAVAALEAAHIRPHADPATTNSPSNGLLLRGDIHTLFDLGLLRVNPATMAVDLDERLRKTSYGELHGKPIWQPQQEHFRPNVGFLVERWEK